MMTIDDEGEGGVLANDDVITRTTIFGKFLGFFKEFFQNFPKNLQNLDKNFQLSEEIFTKINVILFLWHHISRIFVRILGPFYKAS